MTIQELRSALENERPPDALPLLLQALWWDAKGNWGRAHEIAQDIDSPDAAWVHAYLHRKEGDLSNAGYWYSRAGKPRSHENLEAEWAEIAGYLLKFDS